jgi:hypothetical protein
VVPICNRKSAICDLNDLSSRHRRKDTQYITVLQDTIEVPIVLAVDQDHLGAGARNVHARQQVADGGLGGQFKLAPPARGINWQLLSQTGEESKLDPHGPDPIPRSACGLSENGELRTG